MSKLSRDEKLEMVQPMQVALQEAMREVDPTVEVSYRLMFGGAGFYAGDVMFGVWAGGNLALKLDEPERDRLMLQEGAAETMWTAYVQIPESMLMDVEALTPWVGESLVSARASKKSKRRR